MGKNSKAQPKVQKGRRSKAAKPELDVKICATPGGPCVEARSTSFQEVLAGLAVGALVTVGAIGLAKALTSPRQ